MSPEGKIVSGSVYKIVCRTNGKVYIGESTNITMRTNAYSKGHCKGQVKLYNSIKKYGWNDHDFSILHVTGQGSMKDIKSELWAWEKYYICLNDSINNGLNCREGGIGVSVVDGDTRSRMSAARMGMKFSDEHRENLRLSHLGNKRTPESIEKFRQKMTGRKLSPEHVAKMQASRLAGKGWDWHKSAEGRESAGRAHRGKKMPEHVKEHLRKINTGRKRSPESIEKTRLANLGSKRTPEQIKRISEAHKGKVPSPESRAKQAESMRASIARRKALGTYKNH